MLTSLHRMLPSAAQAAHIEHNGDRLVARLRVLIEASFRQDRLIADYARDLAVSERHLIRVCQQFSERSPMQMVLGRRLMESVKLLRFTSLSVNEIALELGFHDNGHFSRFFKAKMGSSPIAWRRRQDQGE
jgi:AraC-like DNA-binding protein